MNLNKIFFFLEYPIKKLTQKRVKVLDKQSCIFNKKNTSRKNQNTIRQERMIYFDPAG